MQPLPVWATMFWVFVGIIISIVLPIVVNILKPKDGLESGQNIFIWAWKKYAGNQYVQKFFAAIIVAAIIVFLFNLEFTTPRDAALAGFAWESFVNKL